MALLDTVHELSVAIGPRPAGSAAEREACELLATKVSAGERPVQRHEFTYRGWQDGGHGALRLEGGEALRGLTWPYTLPSGEHVAGALADGGRLEVIRDRLACSRFDVVADGRIVGRVLMVPSAEVRPTPNPSPWDALPTLVVGSEHEPALVDAVASGARVSLVTGGREALAHGTNLLLPPADGSSPRLVVVAHYDSVPESPGANDNAGGAAVLCELALRLDPSAPVLLVLATAEELMFLGARALVAQLQDEERIDELAGSISIDMVGVGGGIRVRALPGSVWDRAGRDEAMVESIDRHTRASDHIPFHDAGIDAAQITRLGDPEYHSRKDTPERLAEAALQGVVDVLPRLIGSVLAVG